MITFPHQFNGILDSPGTGIWPEVFCLIPLGPPAEQDSGIILLYCHTDVGIALVILEHRIVMRAVLFDQVAFQHQRLQLGVGDNIFKIGYM